MIDSSVKLLDKLVQFLNHRREAKEFAFAQLVAPTYENLKTIHEDYLRMFKWCEYELKKGADIYVIAEQLMKDRLQKEALRQSILAFVRVHLKNDRLKNYELFFKAVEMYFEATGLTTYYRDTWSTVILKQMEY
jgi:hypothetical protein